MKKINFNIKIILYIFLFLCLPIFSQNYAIKNYTVEQGLPGSFISSIYQDSDGYIWFGSDGGVGKFDGKIIKRYGLSSGIPLKIITDIVETNNKKLWFSTYSAGVFTIENNNITVYRPLDTFPEKEVYDLEIDNSGNVLFGTNNGLFTFKNKNFLPLNINYKYKGNKIIRAIYCKANGEIWLGTYAGIIVKKGDEFIYFTKKDGLVNNSVLSINEDEFGNIWVGTANGLSMYNGVKWLSFNSKKYLPDNIVYSVLNTSKYGMCFGTQKGFCLYKDGKWLCLDKNKGLISNYVFTLFEDRENNIWVGTQRGASILLNTSIKNFSEKHGLPGNIVYVSFVSSANEVWVSCDKGISYFKNGKWNLVKKLSGISTGSIYGIAEDKDGKIWLTGDIGNYIYSEGNLKKIKGIPDENTNYYVTNFCDSKGRVWIGTENNGVFVYENKQFKHITKEELNCDVGSLTFFEDSKKNIWIGFEDGKVRMLQNKKWVTPGFEVYIEKSDITDFTEDNEGNIWISTFGAGLYCEKNETFEHYTQNNGFVEDNCTFLKWYNGKLYVGTTRGLSIYDGNSIETFDSDNGFGSSEILLKSFSIDNLGKFWIGTVGGLTVFEPALMKMKNKLPILHLKEVKVKDTVIFPLDFNKNYSFDYKNNNIDFSFIGLYFSDSDKVVFRYKLEGADEDYIESDKNTVSYRKLPPGNYKFRITTGLKGRSWSEKEIVYKFKIQTPVWEKLWFKIIGLFVLIALMLIILYYLKILLNFVKDYRKKNYFKDFKILNKIGSGGVGSVYLAINKKNNKKIALKILHNHILEKSKINAFENESLICEKLDNKNVIKIYEKGKFNDSYFIAMEYIKGFTLKQMLDLDLIDIKTSLIIFKKLLRVVEQIHKKGILHRDLKPENIMIMFDKSKNYPQFNKIENLEEFIGNNLKILDFGLAKYINKESTTVLDIQTGTPMYLPPEYFLKTKCLSPNIDIYSCGIILYIMLTKKMPYFCKEEDIYLLISSIIYDDPVSPNEINKNIDPEISDFVMSIINKDFKRRLKNTTLIHKKISGFLKKL